MKISHRLRRWFGTTGQSNETTSGTSRMPEGFLSGQVARDLILRGTAPQNIWTDSLVFHDEALEINLPSNLKVRKLHLKNCPRFRALPQDLFAQEVIVENCPEFESVPPSAWVTEFRLHRCPSLKQVPARVGFLEIVGCPDFAFPPRYRCDTLEMPNSHLEFLPGGVTVTQTLNLQNSRALTRISNQELFSLNLSGCERLEYLPDELQTGTLELAGCVRLKWQDWAEVEVDNLYLQDCQQVSSIPDWLTVADKVDVANTGLTELPAHLKRCSLLWRGVAVDERIAFHPETIKPREILQERNSELRRVMLERVGWEKFFAEVRPKVVSRDRDTGGERLLLQFEFEREFEPAVVLSVICPSTSRKYFIRVPPQIRTCHAAAAWIAGFDNPDDYQTIIET